MFGTVAHARVRPGHEQALISLMEEWNRELAVNVTGTFLVTRAVFPIMRKQGYGKIVCLGSVAGYVGGEFTGPHYVASKGAVHSFVKWVARRGGPHSVYANAIAPGPIRSRMAGDFRPREGLFPLGRMGEPEDVAEAVVFLASPASNWITGTVLHLNGGMYLA